ncbi:MAG: amidohydrolase family protein [Candidatus Binataceae bacterium]|nr:amidohydrolase family protein [Candidatus Binataceae bacterium]
MNDVLIKGGTVVDGTGKPALTADVAFTNGQITEVGTKLGSARRTIDADGLLVCPAWVDVHTHYDGQVTWDPQLAPSLWHGVGTVVMGNCGVGFAPVAPDQHEWLIALMEGVEDIPSASLIKGIPWGWESFPEYLNVISAMPRTLDVGTQLTHGALRAYVMGERGAKNKPANADDMAKMAALTREAIMAGALGFSTSRTPIHVANDGEPVPGTYASEAELSAIASAIKQVGRGLLEWVPAGVGGEDLPGLPAEVELMSRISKSTGCPITFLLIQHNSDANQWREELRICEEATRGGAKIIPQVFARPVCTLFSVQGDNPFQYFPAFAPLKNMALADRVAMLRKPEFRARLLADNDPNTTGMSLIYKMDIMWERTYPMGYPLSYTPNKDNSIAAIARREGRTPREVAYDLMLEQDGRAFLMYAAAGYADATENAIHSMIRHPLTALGGSDAGAHVRVICDASVPTYMLTHWVRGHGADDPFHLPLEFVVKKLSRDGARLFGMYDRGTLEPGMKADVNLIDFNGLQLNHPEMINDLPAGMPRLMQTAAGYVATFVSGEAVQENGRETGARPGKVVRGGERRPL